MRLDFLALTPGEEGAKPEARSPKAEPRERESESRITHHASRIPHHASAYIPFRYIADARQRIEIYRKLAQATDQAGLRSLKQELRDRFGPLPPALELLLRVAEIKVLASERGITVIEVKDDKLMLTRNNDYVMAGQHVPAPDEEAGRRPLEGDRASADGIEPRRVVYFFTVVRSDSQTISRLPCGGDVKLQDRCCTAAPAWCVRPSTYGFPRGRP